MAYRICSWAPTRDPATRWSCASSAGGAAVFADACDWARPSIRLSQSGAATESYPFEYAIIADISNTGSIRKPQSAIQMHFVRTELQTISIFCTQRIPLLFGVSLTPENSIVEPPHFSGKVLQDKAQCLVHGSPIRKGFPIFLLPSEQKQCRVLIFITIFFHTVFITSPDCRFLAHANLLTNFINLCPDNPLTTHPPTACENAAVCFFLQKKPCCGLHQHSVLCVSPTAAAPDLYKCS